MDVSLKESGNKQKTTKQDKQLLRVRECSVPLVVRR